MSQRVRVVKFWEGKVSEEEDEVALEEPLLINIVGDHSSKSIYVMRTPGDDEYLALGFAYTNGLIRSMDNLREVSVGEGEVTLHIRGDVVLRRELPLLSSCGICGDPRIVLPSTVGSEFRVGVETLLKLPSLLISRQRLFSETGGLHAAAAFSVTGELLDLYEDVGRHNAVDKLVGKLMKSGGDGRGLILQVSGRVGFEIVQKASVIGFPLISAISAPSSSAVKLSQETGVTLVGFSRKGRLNVYSHPERLIF